MKTQTYTGRALRLAVASILAIGVGAFSVNSYAGTDTADLTVSANIQETCAASTTAVAFGTYDPVNAGVIYTTGKVTLACTKGATGTILLSEGANPGSGSEAGVPIRRMKHGTADYLNYALFKTSQGVGTWGGTLETGKVFTEGTGSAIDETVYGTLAGGQTTAPVGDYLDTVVVTLDFSAIE